MRLRYDIPIWHNEHVLKYFCNPHNSILLTKPAWYQRSSLITKLTLILMSFGNIKVRQMSLPIPQEHRNASSCNRDRYDYPAKIQANSAKIVIAWRKNSVIAFEDHIQNTERYFPVCNGVFLPFKVFILLKFSFSLHDIPVSNLCLQ